jgi:DNA polymerase III epsilon subunit-like protein
MGFAPNDAEIIEDTDENGITTSSVTGYITGFDAYGNEIDRTVVLDLGSNQQGFTTFNSSEYKNPVDEARVTDSPEDIWGLNTESNLPSRASIVKFSAPVTSMQPGDVTIGDNFTITEVGTEPDARGKISVKGYFPGHEVQEKFWKNTTPINFVRGISEENMPMSGDLPKINKPQYGDFRGGSSSQEFKLAYARWRGMINAARGRWTNRYDVASYEFDPSTDIHRVKVHTNELKPGDVMADPTKGNFVIVSVSDPDPSNPEHADAIEQGLLIVKGYYPGHELQDKKWKPRQEGRNGREYKMDVIRNSELPDSGPLPPINQGETIDGRYVRNTDPAFVKQYNQNLATAASLYNFPSDAPEVDYPQEINPALREAPRAVPTREPRSPFEVSDPFAQGAFAEMLREAGSWENLREAMKGMTFTFFDYETTGLDPNTENPVQLGAVKIRDGVVVDRFNMYMNPGKPLEGWSKANLKDRDGNSLSDEFLQQQASMQEAHQAFADWTGADTILGAQNSRFDRSFLENALSNTGVDFTPTGYIDPQSLARAINADTGNRNKGVALGKLAEEYGVALENWHSADADAEAAALIFGKLLDRAQAENLATGQFDVDAIAAKHAEDVAFFDSVTYPNYLRDLEAWNASQAVDKALSGQEVDVDQLIADSKNIAPIITPESAEDIAGIKASKDLISKPTRLGKTEWVLNDANTRLIDREDVRVNSVEVGDFMSTRDGNRWSQVVGIEEVEDNRFSIHRVDLESGEEFVSGPYWGPTRLDGVRRPISTNSLSTGEEGDPTLTDVVEPSQKPAPRLEHSADDIDNFNAETTVEESTDGILTATTKVFDENGDLVGEQENIVDSINEAQTVGDSVLRALHDDIIALTLEMANAEESTEPTQEEKPSQISDVTYPTQRSEEIVFDRDGNAYKVTIMQMPKRFGGGYEVGVFKDSGLSNWEEAPDIDNFQRFETLEDAKSAGKKISKSLQPEVKTPKKPARSNQQRIEENRARIQNGARLVLEVRGDFGDESYVWDNPDGSTVPLDMSDPEQSGDLTLGRLFGIEGDRVVESPEDVTTALLGQDLSDLRDDDQEGIEEAPNVFEPGTPVDGNIILEGGTVIAPQRVTGPDGREYDVAAILLPRIDGSPERYEIVAVDPNNPNRRASASSAATLGEARALHQDMVNGLADGSTQIDYNFDANTDVNAVTAGDSSPYTTDALMMPNTPAMRRRIIGSDAKAFRKWQAENNIYADGVNQARIGDRVVHSYDGWNSRGEGTVVGWHVVENSGDIPREGYAIVAFRDGSYAIWSNRMLFLNGRTEGVENRTDYEPPQEIETRPELDPMRREQYALTNKYIIKRSRRNRDGTYQIKIYPYISKAQNRQIGETRRAYRMWGEIFDQINEYRRQNGLPVLTQSELGPETPDVNRADGTGRTWIRMMGGTPPTPPAPPAGPNGDNNGGGGTPPVTPPSTPTPTVEPSAPEVSPTEQRTRTQQVDDFVNGFNSTPENSSNQLSVENPYVDFVFISDDTNPNNSVGIEWAEDNQAWSIQVVNGNTPEELRYNTDLDEAGSYATTRLLELRGSSAIPTSNPVPTPIPLTDEERTRALKNSADAFNNGNSNSIEARAGQEILKLEDVRENADTQNIASIEWDADRKAYSLKIDSDFDSLETEYISSLDEAVARAEFRLLALRESRNAEAEIARATELRNFVEEFNNNPANTPVRAAKIGNIVILQDGSNDRTARIFWDNSGANGWVLQTRDDNTYYPDVTEAITPVNDYFKKYRDPSSQQEEVEEPTGLATLPQNPLTIAQRFFNRSIDKLFPISPRNATGRLKGVIYRNFDAVDPNSAKNQNNQPLTQQDFVANGHQPVRAAELAHAANNRPSADYIQSLMKEYKDAGFGSEEKKQAKEKINRIIRAASGMSGSPGALEI